MTPDQIAEFQNAFEGDLNSLSRLVLTSGRPPTEGDVRQASAILRRWLIDGSLGVMCNALGIRDIKIPALDANEAIGANETKEGMRFFLTGGVMFNGVPIMAITVADQQPQEPEPLPTVLLRVSKFLDQPRILFKGQRITCREIIQFTANKLGGVHIDFRRDERQAFLEEASRFLTFGGPPEKLRRDRQGGCHIACEPNGDEALSGFYVEIIAAAASFLSIHLEGERFFRIEVKQMREPLLSRAYRRLAGWLQIP